MMSELEVLLQDAPERSDLLLLFVHGSCSQAAMWRPMMGWFARHGLPSAAVSLRGHGGSGGRLKGATIHDYVDDVLEAARTVGDRPIVLVGHSMGGFIVQHLLGRPEKPKLAAVVLFAPGPSRTMKRDGLRMAMRQPINFASAALSRDVRRIYRGDGLRELLLHPAISEETEAMVRAAIQPESWEAVRDMNRRPPDLSHRGSTPLLVLAGSLDRMVAPAASSMTARDWGGDYIELPGLSHMLPVEPGWEMAAESMAAWLSTKR